MPWARPRPLYSCTSSPTSRSKKPFMRCFTVMRTGPDPRPCRRFNQSRRCFPAGQHPLIVVGPVQGAPLILPWKFSHARLVWTDRRCPRSPPLRPCYPACFPLAFTHISWGGHCGGYDVPPTPHPLQCVPCSRSITPCLGGTGPNQHQADRTPRLHVPCTGGASECP